MPPTADAVPKPPGADPPVHVRLAPDRVLPRVELYRRYSEIGGPYRVRFRNLLTVERRRGRALLLTAAALVLELVFLGWLASPGHLPARDGNWYGWLSLVVVATTLLIELLRLANVVTLGLATLRAADPVPVAPGLSMSRNRPMAPGRVLCRPSKAKADWLSPARQLGHAGGLPDDHRPRQGAGGHGSSRAGGSTEGAARRPVRRVAPRRGQQP